MISFRNSLQGIDDLITFQYLSDPSYARCWSMLKAHEQRCNCTAFCRISYHFVTPKGMTSGKHYLFCFNLGTDFDVAVSKICMPWSLETKIWGTDLDGSNSHLPWGNSDLPIYISPITQAMESCFHVINWIKVSFCQSAYNAFYSSSSAEFLGCSVSWTQL